jgi:hypothetical protein
MADSANILSIMNALGIDPATGQPMAAPQTNVLQQMPQAPQAPQAPPQAEPPTSTADIYHAATAASPPAPKPRRSLLDTIGRISDVIAQVGGAAPLYQPTLDAREDRSLALGDHARQVDLEALKKTLTEQQVAAGALEPQLAERKRIGTALGAVAGQHDAAELWPSVAEQAGIDPQRTAAIGQILQRNPGAAAIFAKALGAADNLGKNVYFGTNSDGKTVAYQVGPDGAPHVLDFGTAGITPSEPIKVVDTGGTQVIVGQSGMPKKILPKTVSPSTVLTTRTQKEIASGHDATQITIAGMPARAKDPAGTAAGKAGDANVPTLLNNIEQGFNDLHSMSALPGEGSAVGQIEGAFGRSALGQKIGEQTGNAAAQKRLEIMKNVSALQQAMLKSLPASATRTKFEQEMLARGLPDPSKMSLKTAQTVINQLRKSYAEAVTSLNRTPVTPKNVKPRVSNDGWSVVGVK